MQIKIHEFAQQELNEAIEWYDLQAVGLGNHFKKIVMQQIQKVAKNPSWFLQEDGDIYKAYTLKFPYKILFSFDKKKINCLGNCTFTQKTKLLALQIFP